MSTSADQRLAAGTSAGTAGLATHAEGVADLRFPRPVFSPRTRRSSRVRRGWLVRRLLLAADLVGLSLAFAATEAAFAGNGLIDTVGIAFEVVVFVGLLPLWVVAAKVYGLYDRDGERAAHSTADELVDVFHLLTVGVWLFFALSWIVGLKGPNQAKLATFWLLAIVGVAGSRAIARAVARRRPAYIQDVVIVGAGEVGQLIGRKILQHPEYGINVLGFVDAEPRERRNDLGDLTLLGAPSELADIVRDNDVDRVIVAFSKDDHEQLLQIVHLLQEHDVQIDLVPRLFEAVNPRVGIHTLEGLPLLVLPAAQKPRSSLFLKRSLDFSVAAILLVLFSPVFAVIALLVRRDSPGPILFRQPRLGMKMRPFTVFKFRTMRADTDDAPHRAYLGQIMEASALPTANNLYKLDRADVTTRVGRWLRKTSLDELPQLFNVLRGDMSLVGPRPAIPYELELYSPHHYERFLVPAGLTGLWQVEARAHSTFREALELDVAYVRGWSLGLDLRLALKTPLLMLRRQETV